MNGRYFAGKQITCEFVAVTRWKAAICGEFMRSRYKTCSHGVACNFIHCFRNPGGDYEWADWDNPPPRYWIRKMSALFGPSVDTIYEKTNDAPDFRNSEGSDRKKLKHSSNRHVSKGSRDEDMHTRHSSQDYSHSMQKRSSHSMNYEHSRHRRDSSAADKRRRLDIEDTNARRFSAMGNDNEPYRHKHGERHRSDHVKGEEKYDKTKHRKHHSDGLGGLEPESSDWPPDFTDTNNGKSHLDNQSTSRYDDIKKSRRGSSEYYSPDIHHSTAEKPTGKEHSTTRRSRCGIEDDYQEERGGRVKSRKHKDRHDLDDRWVATNSDVDSDVDRYRSSSSKGKKLGRKDDADPDAEARHQRSRRTKDGKRRKHYSGNKQHNGTEEDTSDSSTRDVSSDSWGCRSGSSENVPAHRSKRKQRQSKEKSSS